MDRVDLRNFSYDDLTAFVCNELGEKPYRARQIYEWLYLHHVTGFEDMTNLSKPLRAKLVERCRIDPLEPAKIEKSKDGAEKLQFVLEDGSAVEAVLMPNDGRVSLCLSTQAGCAMGCAFCFTGSLKLERNLTCAEIVEQFRSVTRYIDGRFPRITNVVLMGMGEPLANLDNVVTACSIFMHEHSYNLSARKVIVSTCGLIPQITEFAARSEAVLAVSLNATTDEVRSQIMPVNRRYPLADLVATLEVFPKARRKRLLLEYVMLGGVNSSAEDARRLCKIARRVGCKVNLIPYNAHPASGFEAPSMENVLAFQRIMIDAGLETFIRQSRGQDISGACGMLGKRAGD